jgi:hypothetical protein
MRNTTSRIEVTKQNNQIAGLGCGSTPYARESKFALKYFPTLARVGRRLRRSGSGAIADNAEAVALESRRIAQLEKLEPVLN